MYIQTLPISKCILNPESLSLSAHFFIPCPPTAQYTKLASTSSSFKYGSCSLGKRVSESQTGLRNHGGLIGVRCEGLQGEEEDEDGFYMRRCVDLARKAIGCTSPNPMVGCVIVKDGNIVGEGFHPKAGQPHAEVFALRDAGDLAENGTAYMSLEPCNHYGRTPPCTEALIKANVRKVVIGMVDPNPIVASMGVDRLRDAGIDVTVGVEEELCKKLNEPYIHQMLTGKPFVTLRYTLTINGYISDHLGEEVMESSGYYSQFLKEYDAVILSSTLFTQKYSFPASKELGANQPLLIVIEKCPSSPIQIPVLTTEATFNVTIFTDKETAVRPETAKQGIEMVVSDRIDLSMILEYCKGRGLCNVLLDLRGNFGDFDEILESGFEQNLLQKVVVEVLPIWGGSKEESAQPALKNVRERLRLKNLTSRISGKSVLLEGYF